MVWNVGGDQQGRVVQGLPVALQLAIGGVQIPMQPLEFPGEIAALVHIGAPVPPGRLAHGALKGVPLLARVDLARRAVFHHAAEVDEPFLRAGGFLAAAAAPFGDKILRGHHRNRSVADWGGWIRGRRRGIAPAPSDISIFAGGGASPIAAAFCNTADPFPKAGRLGSRTTRRETGELTASDFPL